MPKAVTFLGKEEAQSFKAGCWLNSPTFCQPEEWGSILQEVLPYAK